MLKNKVVARQIQYLRRGKKPLVTKSMMVWDLGEPLDYSWQSWKEQVLRMRNGSEMRFSPGTFEMKSTYKGVSWLYTLFGLSSKSEVVMNEGVYTHTFTPHSVRGYEFATIEMDGMPVIDHMEMNHMGGTREIIPFVLPHRKKEDMEGEVE